MKTASKLGTLYLVPNTLGDDARSAQLTYVMPIETMRCASQLTHWIVEDAKTARALLKSIDTLAPLTCPIQEMQMTEWRGAARNAKYGDKIKPEALLEPLLRGIDIGLMSEAGVPGVADPGAELVWAAHRLGAGVKPLVGPSSLLLALMASGLNGQRFAFQGYLPQDGGERTARLKQLESESRKLQQTQLWIETPYRNAAMMASCLQALAPQTHLCLALDLSLPTEEIRSMALADWKKIFSSEAACATLQNRPCVFLLLAH
jgi:16S rRNA (cytidine1402-2'-O)-methyltransferase